MRVNHWNEYPFARVLFSFVAGIILYLETGIHIPIWSLVVFCFFSFLTHFLARAQATRTSIFSNITALLLQLTFLLGGCALSYQNTGWKDPLHFTHFDTKSTWAIVRITEPFTEKEKTFKATAEVMIIGNQENLWRTFGKTLIYLSKDSATAWLKYGDLLLIKNNFKTVTPPSNPDEFNYKQFLLNKGISKTAFIQANQWQILHRKIVNPVFQFTYKLRDYSLEAFTRYLPSQRESAVAQALIIGFRDDMSSETLQSYTAAGVVHVLAVSGLHVGILFAFLHQLLFFLNRKKNGKIVQAIIIITIIWLFALLTGLSGSVVRSAAMFSIVTIGKNMKRTINMNNMLASSAVVILTFDPMLITDVGFQLSYVAVFGITTLSSSINGWLNRENKIVDHLWKMISISLAAQIATLPITIFYFNQFPSYFLLANLFAIPVAGIILHLGIGLIIFQFLPSFAWVIGKVTWLFTYSLNEYIIRIQELPSSVIHLPSVSLVQTILLTTAIVCLSMYFTVSGKKNFLAAVVSLLVILSINSLNSLKEQNKKLITVYSLKDKCVIEFRYGKEAVLFCDGSQISPPEYSYLQRHWQLNRIECNAKALPIAASNYNLQSTLFHDSTLFEFRNHRLALVNEALPQTSTGKPLHVNTLIISGNPPLTIRNLIEHYKADAIVFSRNNSQYRIKKWRNEANILKVKTYDVSLEGAFIKEL